MNEGLYMFAIMPPEELAKKVHMQRELFSEQFGCVKALRPPVHITLYEPFRTSESLTPMINDVQQWAGRQKAVNIALKGYNFFKNRRSPVVYIDIVKNDLLRAIRNSFLVVMRKHMDVAAQNGPYSPHFTIGYRDVKPEMMPNIIEQYGQRHFKGAFVCEAIYLWRHNGKNWEIEKTFSFMHPTEITGTAKQSELFL